MDHQTSSPLFTLPSEIRDRIYGFYLAFTSDDFADSLRPRHTYLDAAEPHSTALPTLMLTCRRACAELQPDVQASAVMRVRRIGYNERRVGFAVHGVLRFERLHRVYLVIDMDYANWNSWLDFFQAFLQRASKLEHLTIDWAPRPVTSTAKWEINQAEKKDQAFLQLFETMTSLQTVWMYGQVPTHWKDRIEQDTKATVKVFPYRWWRESDMY